MANFELKVQAPQNAPVVWNYEELKENLTVALADYKGRTYTEAMLPEAKEDAAKLNKLKKAISDERIAQKKAFMKPFETFEAQAKEICEMIDTASSGIKEQLDTFEQKRIEEKRNYIRELYAEIGAEYDSLDFITLDKIFNDKWLNKTTTDKAIATEITEHFEKAIRDLEVIGKMPNCSFEAKESYKTTLDLNKALSEGERIAQIEASKRQAALEKAQEQVAKDTSGAEETVFYDIAFKCRVTLEQAKALSEFCKANGIKLIIV